MLVLPRGNRSCPSLNNLCSGFRGPSSLLPHYPRFPGSNTYTFSAAPRKRDLQSSRRAVSRYSIIPTSGLPCSCRIYG